MKTIRSTFKLIIGCIALFFAGCNPSLHEGIYIGQKLSIIEVKPDNSLTAQDVRLDSNSIRAVSRNDSAYQFQIKGTYQRTSNTLSLLMRDSIRLTATTDDQNIIFGEGSPEQTWSRWYGGSTLSDYKLYLWRLIRTQLDIIICNLYSLALHASAYIHKPLSERGGGGSYYGFQIEKYAWQYQADSTLTYFVRSNKGTEITFEAKSSLYGAWVDIQLDASGEITGGPNASGW